MRKFRRTFFLFVRLYAVYIVLLALLQTKIIFPGQGIPATGELIEAFADAEKVWFELGEEKVPAVYLPAEGNREGVPVVIVAHGNGEIIDHWVGEADVLRSMGVAVMLVEYPGYGEAGGKPRQKTNRAIFIQAWDWVKALPQHENSSVIGLGRSIGSGAITDLSEHRHLDAMVLLSPFTSLTSMARRMGVPGFLLRTKYDNRRALDKFSGPVFISHGERDRVIPFSHGEALAADREGCVFVPTEAGHNDFSMGDMAVYGSLKEFFENCHQVRIPEQKG